MSRVLPILFSTDMVRAILDGMKTATRRIVKLPKHIKPQEDGLYTLFEDGTCYENQNMEEIIDYLKPPYQSGDILYVRETWHKYTKRMGNGENCQLQEFYGYKASIANSEDANEKWRPSIHMLKEAARIWLKVTDVRVDRLQGITEKQAKAEGVKHPCVYDKSNNKYIEIPKPEINSPATYRFGFAKLWNSTINKSDFDQYYWDANPWVWVIEFERCEKPEEL